ncbi:hypothetical protein [Streptomyces sp. PA03-2a]|uniref:hypothetical protein n=1 Tax=Streptomyces sp. PA03-2a TaxID=3028701 RepID=UPI0029BEBE9D|nr:hypothetical protein [Streptomyces sp. PA03-2a]MDX2733467.1 hypothetical protein [Streptomyces sp. PA03-2a]
MNYREHAITYAAERGWEHVTASMTLGSTRVTVDEFRKGAKAVVATFMNIDALPDWPDYWTLGHYDFGDGRHGRIEAVQSHPDQKQLSLEKALDEPA